MISSPLLFSSFVAHPFTLQSDALNDSTWSRRNSPLFSRNVCRQALVYWSILYGARPSVLRKIGYLSFEWFKSRASSRPRAVLQILSPYPAAILIEKEIRMRVPGFLIGGRSATWWQSSEFADYIKTLGSQRLSPFPSTTRY